MEKIKLFLSKPRNLFDIILVLVLVWVYTGDYMWHWRGLYIQTQQELSKERNVSRRLASENLRLEGRIIASQSQNQSNQQWQQMYSRVATLEATVRPQAQGQYEALRNDINAALRKGSGKR